MIYNRLIVLLLLLLAPMVQGQGVHVHGLGTLQVASEKSKLTVLLTIPAMDVLGFEHAPSSAAQKAAVIEAAERFRNVDQIVQPDPDARCSLEDASVASALLAPAEKGRHHQHGHHHHDHARGNDGHHADFTAEYNFSCSRPERLQQLRLALFEWLAELKLNAEVVTDRGAHAATLDRQSSTLRLDPGL